jgi:hypothetical protein
MLCQPLTLDVDDELPGKPAQLRYELGIWNSARRVDISQNRYRALLASWLIAGVFVCSILLSDRAFSL